MTAMIAYHYQMCCGSSGDAKATETAAAQQEVLDSAAYKACFSIALLTMTAPHVQMQSLCKLQNE